MLTRRTLVAAGATAAALTPHLAAAKAGRMSPLRALHERLLVLDTHLDTPANLARPGWNILERHTYANDLSEVDYPRMVQGGLDGGFWAIFTPQGPLTPEGFSAARDAAFLRAAEIREMVAHNSAEFELAFVPSDAARIAARHKRVVFQSIENSYPFGNDVTLVRSFYALGVRMLGLVHFSNNQFADSATDPVGKTWQGISPAGKELVAEANRLGMILDASHASDDVFDQLLALSRSPIILSHSGCRAVHDHPRNIDDDRLKKLAATGGVIQLNSLSSYLITTPPNPERQKAQHALYLQLANLAGDTPAEAKAAVAKVAKGIEELNKRYPVPRATFEDFMAHVLHALNLVGPDHVGIGADWDGGGGVSGLGDCASLPRITECLVKEGYSEAALAKIWSGNALRLLQQAQDARAVPSPATEPVGG